MGYLGKTLGILGGAAGIAGEVGKTVDAAVTAADKTATALRPDAEKALNTAQADAAAIGEQGPLGEFDTVQEARAEYEGDIKGQKLINKQVDKAAKKLDGYKDLYKSNFKQTFNDIYKGNFDAPTFMMANALARQEQEDRNNQISEYKARINERIRYDDEAAKNAISIINAKNQGKIAIDKNRHEGQMKVLKKKSELGFKR